MKYAKSLLMGIGSVVLAGLILTLLAPKAAHAVVATAIQVMNTSANPVPVDEDNSARHAFTFTCPLATDVCRILTPSNPTGTYVIEYAYIAIKTTSPSPIAALDWFYKGVQQEIYIPLTANPDGYAMANMPVLIYVDGDTEILCGLAGATASRYHLALVGHNVTTP